MNREYLLEEPYAPEFPMLGVVSAWFGGLLILVTAVVHLLKPDYSFTPTGAFIDGLHFILVAFILASLLYLALRATDSLSLAALPLFINMCTFVIIMFVPFATLWREARFRWRWHEYNEVINLVETDQLSPDAGGYAQLPTRYQHLSSENGAIKIDRSGGIIRVFFYTHRNSPWNFAGFMFRSGDDPPQSGEFNGRWQIIENRRPNWFYTISY